MYSEYDSFFVRKCKNKLLFWICWFISQNQWFVYL